MPAASKENTFFTKEIYNHPGALEINQEVLDLVYRRGILSQDLLNMVFSFHTDTKAKAETLESYLLYICPECSDIKIKRNTDYWEIFGVWGSLKMTLSGIGNSNKLLWDIGYASDCLFKSWQIIL